MDREPVFLLLILPKHQGLTLLLKLTIPIPEIPGDAAAYQLVAQHRQHSQLGFLLPLLLSGTWWPCHEDGRVDDSIRLASEYQCALHTACAYGGKSSGRPYFVAGECLSRT